MVVGLLSTIGCAHSPVTHSWTTKASPVAAALREVAKSTTAPVAVAIYGEARTPVSDKQLIKLGFDPERWENSLRNEEQTRIEQSYLEQMRPYKNFHLVDRMTVSKLFEEIKFSMTGALSPAIRVKIGEMSGATHLILFEVTRYPTDEHNRGIIRQTTTVRLIHLETGEVLASQTSSIQW
jgi:hypothetical protein